MVSKATSLYELPEREGNPHWPMPGNYSSASKASRREMRLALLGGWFDPDVPQELMRRDKAEIFVAALEFFVAFYLKQSESSSRYYYWPDPAYKRTIREMFTKVRAALVAPRGGCKTATVVYELCPFLSVTRPGTSILIGSETDALTKEKLKEVRRRIERNGVIMADFGKVWPTARSSLDWNNGCLDFNNGSSITGSSIDMATRGRHPIAGVIDDPEGKRSRSAKWRSQYFEWLFHDYLNQFNDHGTHVMWIGTILRDDSCLWRAIHDEDKEHRFANWSRKIIKMIDRDESTGELVSNWPEYLSVEGFRKKCGETDVEGHQNVTIVGAAAAHAEFQGEPWPMGDRMFVHDNRRNGFLLCRRLSGEQYMYDPKTHQETDWDEFLEANYKVAAVDVADSEGHGDPSGIVVGVYDHEGVLWVVDAWTKKVFSDQTAQKAMEMSHEWKVTRLGWEVGALSNRIYRETMKLRQNRFDDGFHVPMLIPMMTRGVKKEMRVERMRPDWDGGRIRIMSFHEIDGHSPDKHRRRGHLQQLSRQFDTFTGDGATGHDDLIDACEMMHRMCDRRPKRLQRFSRAKKMVMEYEKLGLEMNPLLVPEEHWSNDMRERFDKATLPAHVVESSDCDAYA